MARYRKVDVRTWIDEGFQRLSPSPPNAQTLWFYLMTNPDTVNIPGLYRVGEAGMAEALKWPLKAFRKAFREVLNEGMAEADWEARVIWIPNAIEYNKPESANVVTSWRMTWDEIPNCNIKDKAYQRLKAFLEGMNEAFLEAFEKACRKPSLKPSPNQEQEQEQDKSTLSGKKPDGPPITPKEEKNDREIEREILQFLNKKAGTNYQEEDANLELITPRLKKASPDDIKRVIDMKVLEWKHDAKNYIYLRPSTLFNRTKFAQYYGQLPPIREKTEAEKETEAKELKEKKEFAHKYGKKYSDGSKDIVNKLTKEKGMP